MTNEPISILADALLAANELDPDDRDCDLMTTLTAMRALLDDTHFIELCQMTDACPIHICDIEICADDDDPECADYRARF